ncbi:MAG: hypothetical protein J2P46_01520 [Zavarzinella sp.]|nr:hypothetical protein [Zavarzinella sp.]
MILIGFTWVFIAIAAGLVTPYVFRGAWADHGPTAMFAASFVAFLGGSVGAAMSAGPHGYTSVSEMPTTLGLTFSILGGIIGFAIYAMDVRMNPDQYAGGRA